MAALEHNNKKPINIERLKSNESQLSKNEDRMKKNERQQ